MPPAPPAPKTEPAPDAAPYEKPPPPAPMVLAPNCVPPPNWLPLVTNAGADPIGPALDAPPNVN